MNVPSGYTALDMIGFTDKGVYNSATAYVRNDIAHYNGNLWRCLVDDTTGITPAEGANWTVFLAEPTSAAEDIIAQVEPTAVSTHIYAVGDQMILGDILYTATQAINIGDSLAVGTNIALSDTIVKQLAEKADSADLATVATTGFYSDLTNKPTLGTAAAKDVPASGDASTTEVVMGDDTRLTNARNAADVYSWAKALTKPTYNGSEISTNTSKTGTAQQSITDTISSGTTMDNAIGTLLNNDKTLDTGLSSVKETLNAYVNDNGCKNYVSSDATSATKQTVNFVKNADGTYTVSGTNASSSAQSLYVNESHPITLKANQKYTLSGGVSSNLSIQLRTNTSGTQYHDDSGNTVASTNETGTTFTNGNSDVNVYLMIRVGGSASVSGTIKPMLRIAGDIDNTYVPYSKTNKELTDYINSNVFSEITVSNPSSGSAAYWDLTNAIMKAYQNPVTRTIVLSLEGITVATALAKGTAREIVNVGTSSTKALVKTRNRARVTLSGTAYDCEIYKSDENTRVAIYPFEDVPVGAALQAQLTWNY